MVVSCLFEVFKFVLVVSSLSAVDEKVLVCCLFVSVIANAGVSDMEGFLVGGPDLSGVVITDDDILFA